MPDDRAGVFLGPGEGDVFDNPIGGPLTFKLRGVETNGALAAFVSTAPAGQGPPLHRHETQDEIWYALEGTLRIKLGDVVRDAPAGTFVFIPKGLAHTWQNVGEGPARILVITSPAHGLEQFFERFASLPAESSPLEAFRRLGAEAGMTVLGPPLGDA